MASPAVKQPVRAAAADLKPLIQKHGITVLQSSLTKLAALDQRVPFRLTAKGRAALTSRVRR